VVVVGETETTMEPEGDGEGGFLTTWEPLLLPEKSAGMPHRSRRQKEVRREDDMTEVVSSSEVRTGNWTQEQKTGRKKVTGNWRAAPCAWSAAHVTRF
jgi:hypothetical protein